MKDIVKEGLKRNLNLRPRKDDDLLQVVKEEGFESQKGDYSHFVRELMRDGLRFRMMKKMGKLQGEVFIDPVKTPEETEEERLERKYGEIVDSGMLSEGR